MTLVKINLYCILNFFLSWALKTESTGLYWGSTRGEKNTKPAFLKVCHWFDFDKIGAMRYSGMLCSMMEENCFLALSQIP